ncbi:MAG: hypothetical protein R3342_01520 [Lutibacter sp.]|uniref:hypothetical protein n=1 Tax=Lutibacter sp. TaxID=1925666 RepID=UPI00299EC813|nr:hypothetical protein [Lutibacter sp.]MDX1828200.1 hypothetical protein [Lutibacter sp.]
MQVHGLIHKLPKEIKTVIAIFIIVLSVGFYGGVSFINKTTSMQPSGIETQYLGNENNENAEIMKFKKSEHEVLTIIHNHILSMSVIFFLLSLILSTTSINKQIKHFLMFEPFVSVVLTFGGIYFLWKGFIWVKYVIMFSGILMTLSYTLAVIIIIQQLFAKK